MGKQRYNIKQLFCNVIEQALKLASEDIVGKLLLYFTAKAI